MDTKQHYMTIKTLDNLPRVLFWTIDEVILVMLPFFLAVWTGCFWLLCIGLFVAYAYIKLKKYMPRGTLTHSLYWLLPHHALRMLKIVHRMPPSHYRETIL